MPNYNVCGLSSVTSVPILGRTSLLLNYSTDDPAAWQVSDLNIPSTGYHYYWAGPAVTGNYIIVPVFLTPCGICDSAGCPTCSTTSVTYNFTAWLTTGISNPQQSQTSTRNAIMGTLQVTSSPGCSATIYERGCVDMKVPDRLYVPDSADMDVTFPLTRVVCTGSAYIGISLSSNTQVCETEFVGPFACNNVPPNITFHLHAYSKCNFTRDVSTRPSFVTVNLYDANTYTTYVTNNALRFYYLDYYAGYTRQYSFTVAFPNAIVPLAPNSSASVSLGDTAVTLPPNVLPNGVDGSLYLELSGSKNGSATDVARVEVQLANGSEFKVYNLSVPLTVSFPLTPDRCKQPVCHYWDVNHSKWSTEGCVTLQNTSAHSYICSCTHATDFSMLLLESQEGSCVNLSPSIQPFYAFAAVYLAIALVALYYTIKVLSLCREKLYLELIMQHFGVFTVCVLRTFLSLYQSGVGGDVSTIAIATISAVPRLVEFVLFSFIVSRWGAILHFSMSGGNPFKKARPYFIGINVFAAAIVIYVFVAFAVSPSYDAAIVGEALSAFNALFLSVGFMVYACWLHKQFGKIGANSHTNAAQTGCGPRRLVWVGWLLSVAFVAQGIFACLALSAIPRDLTTISDPTPIIFYLDLYNGLYRLFNIITLACILLLYHEGISRMTGGKTVPHSSRHSTHGSSHGSSHISI